MTLEELENVVSDHKDQLVPYAQTWLRDEAEAQDIVQETLEELLRKKSYLRYNPRKGSATPVTWLCKCIKYRCIDRLKTTARRRQLEETKGAPRRKTKTKRRRGVTAQDENADDHNASDMEVEPFDDSATQELGKEGDLELIPGSSEALYSSDEYEADLRPRFSHKSGKEAPRLGTDDDEAVDKRPACHCVQIEIRRILKSLPPKMRKVICLYHMGRPTTLDRVAKQLRWTPRTVQVRLEKAEALLKEDLARRGFQDPLSC